MFRTTIKALSLFRKNSSYRYSYSGVTFKKIKQPTLYNDGFNMFMLCAFVKESTTNTNNANNENNANSKETKYSGNQETELKVICQITGCEKNNKDCSCEKICIVTKSEICMICDLLQ
jgi:hypothetical protein